jgi:uncharacterized protein DUF6285
MRDRPDGATLRTLARRAAAEGEDEALVARALAIAEREEAAGAAPGAALRAALARRYGVDDAEQLLRRFAAEIRAGAFDRPGPERADALRLLWAMTWQKLAESNPGYLAAAGGTSTPCEALQEIPETIWMMPN